MLPKVLYIYCSIPREWIDESASHFSSHVWFLFPCRNGRMYALVIQRKQPTSSVSHLIHLTWDQRRIPSLVENVDEDSYRLPLVIQLCRQTLPCLCRTHSQKVSRHTCAPINKCSDPYRVRLIDRKKPNILLDGASWSLWIASTILQCVWCGVVNKLTCQKHIDHLRLKTNRRRNTSLRISSYDKQNVCPSRQDTRRES